MRAREWGAFWLLGTIWGSSYLWIKIALAETGPLTLAAVRLLFGLAGLAAVAWATRQALPRDPRLAARFAVLGLLNTALPFALISWGETRIASGPAAVLTGTTPLFALVIAHFWLRDEPMTPARAAGLVLGLAGVVLLVHRGAGPAAGGSDGVAGEAAVLTAACSYAVAATYARRYLRGQPPLLQAASAVFAADAMLWLAVPAAEWPLRVPRLPLTWLALGWLGLAGTCLGYLLYYYLFNAWGAARATTVTYVFPVIGVLLGVAFLGESVSAQSAAGTVLVVTGIVVANRPARPRIAPTGAVSAAAAGDG